MHNFWHRLNGLLTYAATVLAVLCLAISITGAPPRRRRRRRRSPPPPPLRAQRAATHSADAFHSPPPPAVSVSNVAVESLQREGGHDRAALALDLSADLSREFSWNTKQLFAWVAADFATPASPATTAIFWSAILEEPADAAFAVERLRAAYPYAVTDRAGELRGRLFNVTVGWSVMPRVGAMRTRSVTFGGFAFPDAYVAPPPKPAAVDAGAEEEEEEFEEVAEA
jgi:signal peptidase complex subunit 3